MFIHDLDVLAFSNPTWVHSAPAPRVTTGLELRRRTKVSD